MAKRFQRKICLVGDGAVGKTSLIRKFVNDQFDDDYIMTIGTKVTTKEVKVTHNAEDYVVNLMIWDVLGQDEFRSIQQSAFQGAVGAMVICDITNEDTVHSLGKWAKAILGVIGQRPLLFLANKSDLIDEKGGHLDLLKSQSGTYGYPYFFTSAKTGKNVEKAFEWMAKAVIEAPPPGKAKTLFFPVKRQKSAEHKRLDKVVDTFCTMNGGQEMAMPTVRRLMEEVGVDQKKPTHDLIDILEKRLEEVDGNLDAGSGAAVTEEEAPHVDGGSNMLILEDRPHQVYRAAIAAKARGMRLMILTQTLPTKLAKKYQMEADEMHWITETRSDKVAVVQPKRLDFELTQRVTEFLRKPEPGVLMFDCVELLAMENDFEKVIKFVKRTNDGASLEGHAVLVGASPKGFNPKQLAHFEKEFDEVVNLAGEQK